MCRKDAELLACKYSPLMQADFVRKFLSQIEECRNPVLILHAIDKKTGLTRDEWWFLLKMK